MSRAKIITKEALNYAEALYQISSDIKNVMEFTALLAVDELRQALVNPTISLKEKYAVIDRKSTRLNSSHIEESRMPSSA